ncbi:MAG: DUF924 family protein [Pseudobdellovibrionaceae bacterium]
MNPQTVLDFWFKELRPEQQFQKNEQLDRDIESRFGKTLSEAMRGELDSWRETAHGRLAEIILLDQFSRNIYRGKKESFEADPLALILAQEAVRAGAAAQLSTNEKSFLYMPFMHSESKEIHKKAVILFSEKGLEGGYKYELAHKAIVDRFGRYPHRNHILGRESTPEEIEFLKGPGSSF